MNRSNQSTTEGNYLRIVVGLNKRAANNHLLHVIFSDGTESKDKERVIYVLCRSVNGAKILKDQIESGAIFSKGKDSLKIGFDVKEGVVKIIDPYTLNQVKMLERLAKGKRLLLLPCSSTLLSGCRLRTIIACGCKVKEAFWKYELWTADWAR